MNCKVTILHAAALILWLLGTEVGLRSVILSPLLRIKWRQNDTYPIGLRERWKSLSTRSTSLCSLQSLPSFTKEDLKSWLLHTDISSHASLHLCFTKFHTTQSLYLTDSSWRLGLQGRWLHQSCWRPAWTGLAFASFLDHDWSEMIPSSCSYVTARNNHKYYLMELITSGVQTHVKQDPLQTGTAFPNKPTGSPQSQAASSCGPSRAFAVDLEQRSGSERRCGSGGTWCWGQRGKVASLHGDTLEECVTFWYSLHSLVDISPVPPAAAWENLDDIVIHKSQSRPNQAFDLFHRPHVGMSHLPPQY